MKFAASVFTAAAAFALASPASAQFAKPDDAIKYRQSVMSVMNYHFGRIGAMANGRAPYEAKSAVEHAEIVVQMSRLPWPAFLSGTDKGGIPTRAKAEIWTDQAKFKEHNEKLVAETGKLLAAAKTNSLDNLKPAFTSTAGTCKGCHDDYRKD